MTTVFDHSHGSVVDRHIGREENKQPMPWTPSLHAALDPGTTQTDLLLDQLQYCSLLPPYRCFFFPGALRH
jgi:hypothetical protein